MSGKIVFSIRKSKEEHLNVQVTRISLFDKDSNIQIHEMDALTGKLTEDTIELTLTGYAFVNRNGKKHICRVCVKVAHSHGDFYEVNFCFQTDDKKSVIYGFTLIKKEAYDEESLASKHKSMNVS